MIVCNIRGARCTINEGVWESENARVQEVLRDEERRWRAVEFPAGPVDPDPDWTSAEHAVATFGGWIEDHDDHRPERVVPGRVY